MTRLTFDRKLFIRHKEEDFRDDGTAFRVYYYKDLLPISVTRWREDIFISINLWETGLKWEDYKDDGTILNEFNGIYEDEFDMDKLIENCEYILNKYIIK